MTGRCGSRSPFLCEGYDGPPGDLRRDPSGFATVGDRGTLVDGVLRVAGRGSEAVVTGGATVLVADVEAALRPVVAGALVVVGLPHPELGQVVAARRHRRGGPRRGRPARGPASCRPRTGRGGGSTSRCCP